MLNSISLFAVETQTILIYVLLAVVIIAFLVLPMISNRKKQKEVNDMYNTINIGDEIMTIGGIMGKVVALTTHESGEKLMTIETGDGSTMTFTIQALRLNYTRTKQRQAELAAQKQAELEAKANKHKDKEADEKAEQPQEQPQGQSEATEQPDEQSEAKPEETAEKKGSDDNPGQN